MKILHAVYSYPPDAAGGTERYVEALCAGLVDEGVESIVGAPAPSDAGYTHGGVRVRRFAMDTDPGLDAMYGAGDPVAEVSFASILDEEQPDLVHMHAVTPACSVRVVRVIKARRMPVVLTYHTPTVSCLRGTMMLRGEQPCDGDVQVVRCASCAAEAHGVGRPLAEVVGHLPVAVGRSLGRLGMAGGAMTAARLSSLTSLYRESLLEILESVDRIVSLAPWVRAVLTANGVPAARIVDCAHGVSATVPPRSRADDGLVRLVHLGRLHPTKGTELLLRAFESVRSETLRLDIHGIAQGDEGSAIGKRLQAVADRDDRIRLTPPIDPADVPGRLVDADAVVVPSQWMETGPLVVLEAFAAGVPVIGSRLGGIADKVSDGRDGLLVSPADSEAAWADVLGRCASEPDLLRSLRRNVAPPRPQQAVARDMAALYADLVADSARQNAQSTGAA